MIIGIYSPGEMGSEVGKVLLNHGHDVIACVAGRSPRTRALAEDKGITLVSDYQRLADEADLILSILVPGQAEAAAQHLAPYLAHAEHTPLYADCNAIAPQTARRIADVVTGVGAAFVDASIIGPPPYKPGVTRFYASGPRADVLAQLNEAGLDVRVIGEEIGQASAVKMCYAALTKGVAALTTELLIGAEMLGVRGVLSEEFSTSQPERLTRMERSARYVPAKARRFAGEMDEIAATFGALGLTPHIHAGAAEVYRLIGETPLADRNPEDAEEPPSLDETLAVLVEHLRRTHNTQG